MIAGKKKSLFVTSSNQSLICPFANSLMVVLTIPDEKICYWETKMVVIRWTTGCLHQVQNAL